MAVVMCRLREAEQLTSPSVVTASLTIRTVLYTMEQDRHHGLLPFVFDNADLLQYGFVSNVCRYRTKDISTSDGSISSYYATVKEPTSDSLGASTIAPSP